jgi:hypothetical protein
MVKRVSAIFDGKALLPDEPVELKPNTRVVLTIESPDGPSPGEAQEYPLTRISGLATDMGVTDLSTRHLESARGALDTEGRER